uniref:hypothetical protein n=1 Tax=Flavobacterium sp. TaxID=239 RepID=UPI0040493CF1
MRKSKSIVRTITIHGSKKNKDEMYFEINFMPFSSYINKKNDYFKFKDYEYKLYPYKWYDLRWIYQIPAYWLLLRAFRNSEARISKQKHKAMSIITLITEMLLATKTMIEFCKLFIDK